MIKNEGLSACVAIMVSNPRDIEKGFKKLLNYAFENRITKLIISLYAPWPYTEWVPFMREGISQNLHITLIINSYSDVESVIRNAKNCEYDKIIMIASKEFLKREVIEYENIEVFKIN